jgi:prepilin-type N-terminal cleavage/methylation domain-containing protein
MPGCQAIQIDHIKGGGPSAGRIAPGSRARHFHCLPTRRSAVRGLTLVELMVVIAIISVLLMMVLSFSWKKILHRSERLGCESNLKSFFTALNAYQNDYGHWPQIPEEKFEYGTSEDYHEWWFEILKEYDIGEERWLCPTDRRERRAQEKPEDRDRYESSYGITNFGPGPNTARQWPQPWVHEMTNFHGDGALLLMPDGSIQASPW